MTEKCGPGRKESKYTKQLGYGSKSCSETWPRGYETFFMLNSTEHQLSTAHKN